MVFFGQLSGIFQLYDMPHLVGLHDPWSRLCQLSLIFLIFNSWYMQLILVINMYSQQRVFAVQLFELHRLIKVSFFIILSKKVRNSFKSVPLY